MQPCTPRHLRGVPQTMEEIGEAIYLKVASWTKWVFHPCHRSEEIVEATWRQSSTAMGADSRCDGRDKFNRDEHSKFNRDEHETLL